MGQKRGTILLVDDDDDLSDAIQMVLEDQGYGVTRAGDGRAALDLLRAGLRPQLILLDLMMPVMNGTETLLALSADPGLVELPVLLISAQSEPAPAGLPVLRKPFDLRALLAAVGERSARMA